MKRRLLNILSFYGTFREMPLVAISNAQLSYLPQNWVGTVLKGFRAIFCRLSQRRRYFAWRRRQFETLCAKSCAK